MTCCLLAAACGGGADAEERDGSAAGPAPRVESPCELVPEREVASVVGPIRSEPKERSAAFGSSCQYSFGSRSTPRYVELIWSDAATFGGVTSEGPDSTRLAGSQDYIVYRRAVSGVGTRAFFVNLNGLEYALWVLDGRRAVAVQAVLGPEELEKFKVLAAAQLAAWR